MSLEKFVEVAEAEVGYTETGDNLTKYGAWYGLDGNPWCVMFVSWCANQAGILTTSGTAACPYVKKEASVSAMKTFYANNRRDLAPSTNSANPNYPKVGDLAVIRNSGSSTDDHMGIIVAVNGTTVTTIEGNASNAVKRVTYTNLKTSYGATITVLLSNHVSY